MSCLSKFMARFVPLLLTGLVAVTARAETFVLPPADVDVVGSVKVVYSRFEDTLLDIARGNGLGYDQLVNSNPGIGRRFPGEGTPIVLPTRYILPSTPREGLTLNISELRIYYYPKVEPGQKPVVIVYPVSVGRMDWKTPLGRTSVVRKMKDPAWYPTASIKAEHARDGDPLPDVIPGGSPDNPLGNYALYLGIPGYLIHGTDERKAFGIGMRVTHGCVRMYPENIEQLYNIVPVGSPVYLIDQPVKAGWLGNTLYLEAHTILGEDDEPVRKVTVAEAMKVINAKIKPGAPVDMQAVELVVEQGSGIPVPVAQNVESSTAQSAAAPVSSN